MRSRLRSPAARSRRARRQQSPGSTKTLVRTAGTAREEVARGNLLQILQILTAGDDVEDADKDIGDAEANGGYDP
jgi:hypothetical protein